MKRTLVVDGVEYIRVDAVLSDDFCLFGMDFKTIAALRAWFIELTGHEPNRADIVRWAVCNLKNAKMAKDVPVTEAMRK